MKNLPTIKDHSREGMNLEKIWQVFRLLNPANTKTLCRLEEFADLDIDKIRQESGLMIRGIILDIDGCLSYNHGEIFPHNIAHLETLIDRGIKIVIYSNMQWSKRYESLKEKVTVLTNLPPKPSQEGFKLALQKLKQQGIPQENVVMVGDNYITDGGAIRAGIPFIHVQPLRTEKEKFTEKVHSALRGFFIWLSKVHESMSKTDKKKS